MVAGAVSYIDINLLALAITKFAIGSNLRADVGKLIFNSERDLSKRIGIVASDRLQIYGGDFA